MFSQLDLVRAETTSKPMGFTLSSPERLSVVSLAVSWGIQSWRGQFFRDLIGARH